MKMLMLGTIIMYAGSINPIPNGFAKCDGQLFPISGNEGLYNTIGNNTLYLLS